MSAGRCGSSEAGFYRERFLHRRTGQRSRQLVSAVPLPLSAFDPGLPGYRYRRLRSMDTETLWEKMREEEEEGEE